MEKELIQIGLEFLFGPIQKFEEDVDGNEITGIKVIDEDKITQDLDKEIGEKWCDLWENDPNETSGMRFDKVKEKELAPWFLEKIKKLIARLEEINDGSYEIEDMITEYLEGLIK